MSPRTAWSLIALSCGAVAVAGVVGLGIDAQVSNDAVSEMNTGVTITPTAGNVAPVESAVPGIKGPAPLPPEEQGLPG
jgi:hypothetical protein